MILLEIILCITSTRFIKGWAIQVSMGATIASIAVSKGPGRPEWLLDLVWSCGVVLCLIVFAFLIRKQIGV